MQMLPVLYLLHHTFVERAGLNDLDWIFWMDFSTELRVPNLTYLVFLLGEADLLDDVGWVGSTGIDPITLLFKQAYWHLYDRISKAGLQIKVSFSNHFSCYFFLFFDRLPYLSLNKQKQRTGRMDPQRLH